MHRTDISIWFFNGILLTTYGLMIGGYGVYELISGHTRRWYWPICTRRCGGVAACLH